ncbi:hypothetical protein PYW08_005362 [Mythimna loreyi]|uniref:Uncharacterized protein n=1 Tax=Mythimna loreyi TaxID=667449 RepID=A0ACC2QLF6_9NEOP|nr:hypothetical protein PYW08_005362 [Mythimna loreyi]
MSDVESVLRKVLDKVIKQIQYNNAKISLKEHTSAGQNYTSTLFSINVTAPERDTLKLFAKVANVNGNFRKIMNIDLMFRTEQFLYSDLVDVYEKIQDDHNLSVEHRFEFPKFYGGESAEGEETVVMEDLTAKGFQTYNRFLSVDWEHAACAVDCLTRFHALSFAYQKADPEKFARDAKRVETKKRDLDSPILKEIWMKMVENTVNVVKEEHKERLTEVLNNGSTDFYDFKVPLSTTVLCHGDYRVSNLLFRHLDGRLDPIVVDYQTLHSGSPVADLLYFEFLCTDAQFRKEHHYRLLDHYFSSLTMSLQRLGIDINEVYPREVFDEEYKTMVSPALIITMAVLPLVLVEAEQAPHMSGIQEVNQMAITPCERFAERYSDLVSDCIDWGLI